MSDTSLPLTVLLGLKPDPSDGGLFNEETVTRAIAAVRNAARGVAALGAVDIGPGVVDRMVEVLSTPVTELAVEAWNKRAEIRKYADLQRYPPDETHEVTLHEHEVKQRIEPKVEVLLGPVTVMELLFPCTVSLTFEGAILVIRGGRITHVRLGDLSVSWELSLHTRGGDAKLIKKEIKRWSLPGRVPLGSGVRIGSS